jgi:DNA-binding LacI/PurR family transcriptional regulator
MSITTKEIARICNVSRGTVDRALNGRPGISEATRERIQQTAREYHYRPHLIASSLSRGKSMSIGVVLFDLKNYYFSQLSNIISLSARNEGYFTYIAVTEKNMDAERHILSNLASRRVDGLILLPIIQGSEYVKYLKSLEIPLITVGNHLPGIPGISINDVKAAYDSAAYIAGAGYKRIVFICPPLRKKGAAGGKMNIKTQDLRNRGFIRYMKRHPDLRYDIFTRKDYTDFALDLVQHGNIKTAFLCSSDVYALELIKCFRLKGVHVPQDAGIMGFDNLDILTYINPYLTTVSTSLEIVGKESVNMLIKLMSGGSIPQNTYAPHSICPGETL